MAAQRLHLPSAVSINSICLGDSAYAYKQPSLQHITHVYHTADVGRIPSLFLQLTDRFLAHTHGRMHRCIVCMRYWRLCLGISVS